MSDSCSSLESPSTSHDTFISLGQASAITYSSSSSSSAPSLALTTTKRPQKHRNYAWRNRHNGNLVSDLDHDETSSICSTSVVSNVSNLSVRPHLLHRALGNEPGRVNMNAQNVLVGRKLVSFRDYTALELPDVALLLRSILPPRVVQRHDRDVVDCRKSADNECDRHVEDREGSSGIGSGNMVLDHSGGERQDRFSQAFHGSGGSGLLFDSRDFADDEDDEGCDGMRGANDLSGNAVGEGGGRLKESRRFCEETDNRHSFLLPVRVYALVVSASQCAMVLVDKLVQR